MTNNKTIIPLANDSEVFISYGWGGESEEIADNIYQIFKNLNFNIVRDKVDLGYKGNIKEFMQRIGKGKYVVVIISDKYLKSENCMFEMLEIKNQGNAYDRIFPVVLNDAQIFDEISRIDYLNFWDDKVNRLKEKVETLINPIGKVKVYEKINQYADISRVIDEITDMLRNMNTLTPDMHRGNNFSDITKIIEYKQKEEKHIAQAISKELIGEKIGNYEIIKLIGSGGFGNVYLAKQNYLNSIYAIKVSHEIKVGK